MPKTLLAWIGLLALVALGLGTAAGLAVLHDRVRIVVQADGTPDAAALTVAQLRDEVGQVQRDLRALADALAAGVQHLATGQDEGAAAHAAALSAQLQKVQAGNELVSARVQGIADGQLALRATLADLADHTVAAAPAPGDAQPGDGPPAAAAPTASPTVSPAAAPATVASVTEPTPPAADTPVRRRSAFAFTLPSQVFRFDARQRFELLPSLSRVGFDAKSTLHDFTGVTSDVQGSFRADFDDPDGAWSGEIRVAARTLRTGVDGRDSNLREHLDTEHFPELRFAIERFVPAADGVDVAKQTARGEVRGTLTIRGRARAFAMPIAVEVDPQRRVVVTGQAPLKLSDYGVPVPSQLGVINMQDDVQVWIALRARARGEAAR